MQELNWGAHVEIMLDGLRAPGVNKPPPPRAYSALALGGSAQAVGGGSVGTAGSAAARPPPRSKYITVTAIANIGAVITLEMIDATTVAPSLIGVGDGTEDEPDRDPDHQDDQKRQKHRPGIAANQAPAATECLDRTPLSATIAGAPTDQMVIRIRPGMMSRMKPIATPIPNRIENTIRGRIAGAADENRSRRSGRACRRPGVLHELDDEPDVKRLAHQADDRGEEPEDHPTSFWSRPAATPTMTKITIALPSRPWACWP